MKPDLLSKKQTGSRLKNLIQSALSTLLLVVTISCFALPAIATGLFDLPNFDAEQVWLVDTADAISNTNEKKLTKTFQEFARETGQEIRMVAIRRLDYGQTVDS